MSIIESIVTKQLQDYRTCLKEKKNYFRECNYPSLLKGLGFTETVIEGKKANNMEETNKNWVYEKEDSDIVLVIVDAPYRGIYQPILLDKEVYEEKIKGNTIYINSSNKKALQGNRPTVKVRKDGKLKNIKLHRLVLDREFDSEDDIDHISHCMCDCLRSDLRVVTHKQNMMNRAFRTQVSMTKDGYKMKTWVSIDTEEKAKYKEELESKGFEFERKSLDDNVFLLKSPRMGKGFYKMINEIEDKFFGEYRYNPLEDYSYPVATNWLIHYHLGMLSKELMNELQKELLLQRNRLETIRYYQLVA